MSSESETSLSNDGENENRDSSTSLGMTNGVANPRVIDAFGIDEKTGEVFLLMDESRPWSGGDGQLHELEEKFNAYASFILDGEMADTHPEVAGKPVRIELRCDHVPNQSALGLLGAIHDQLALQEIRVEVVVRERACGADCACHPERT
jgi:hypothetical protein